MRALLLLAALSACGGQEPDRATPTLPIGCAPNGGPPARCAVSRASIDGRTLLTVTEPDGGFRRFAVDGDGAIRTADGAAPARVARGEGGTIEVMVEDDRYSLPAR